MYSWIVIMTSVHLMILYLFCSGFVWELVLFLLLDVYMYIYCVHVWIYDVYIYICIDKNLLCIQHLLLAGTTCWWVYFVSSNLRQAHVSPMGIWQQWFVGYPCVLELKIPKLKMSALTDTPLGLPSGNDQHSYGLNHHF